MQCEEIIHEKSNENTYIFAVITKLMLEVEETVIFAGENLEKLCLLEAQLILIIIVVGRSVTGFSH
ncbi:hypothetical protein BUE63_20535 [Bacillus sp. MB353a]|nr:hypothetical protein BUE63_20535 [Bacillus sp. MB353a]